MTPDMRTSPPIRRGSMTPRPWFGLVRGFLVALLTLATAGPGRRGFAADAPDAADAPAAPWQHAAARRRAVLLALTAALAAVAAAVQWQALPADAGAAAWAYSALLVLLFTWLAIGFVTALMGAWVLWRGDAHALALPDARAPLHRQARTAVVMPVCNEDIATVFGGLRATCESLAATGALALFDFYVLSDTSDPALRAAELRAWEALRRMMGDDPVLAGGRVFYRWRRRRVKRKAGNVADFCRRWGRNYRYMVVLDADSTMHGDTLVALVRLMEAHPRAGIVQTLPQPTGHGTLHARAQQFAHRVTGRLFALGMAWWQLGDSHYWGHNAIIRVEPFMRHCALAPLPGRGGLSGEILSHDFVEAAMMSRAGFEVWLAPRLAGSWEQNPPHLLDELQRDRRWCQGNLQNARLVAEPGWRPVHRATFATAAFSYLVAPLWLAFIALGFFVAAGGDQGVAGAASAAGAAGTAGAVDFAGGSGGAIVTAADTGVAAAAPGTGSAGLWLLTLVLLLLPRVLAVGAVVALREQRQYGGTLRLVASAVAELLLSALQAPLRMLAHSLFVVAALTGLKLDWRSPSRQADAVAWRDAWARLKRLVLPPLVVVTAWIVLEALAGSGMGHGIGGHVGSGVGSGAGSVGSATGATGANGANGANGADGAISAISAMAGDAGGDLASVLWLLLLPLLLAVPLTVLTASPALGLRAERWGLLWNPEARRPPRTLARAFDTRAFAVLAPPAPPQPLPSAAATALAWSMGRSRAFVAIGALAVAALGALPGTGRTPEPPAWMLASSELLAMWSPAPLPVPRIDDEMLARPVVRERAARRIDDAVRERARAAVQRALELEAEGDGGWPEG